MEELQRTSFAWLDQNFNFPQSRATFTSSLTQIAIKTSILTEPDKLPEESVKAAIENATCSPSSSLNNTAQTKEHSEYNISSNLEQCYSTPGIIMNKKSVRGSRK